MMNWLQKRWLQACSDTIGTDQFWSIAVDHIAINRALGLLIARYAQGCTLDAGAGRLAWRSLLQEKASVYIASDVAPLHRDLAFVCDLQGGIPLRDGSIDTIFCCSVLEHAPEPWRILPEFRRVLRSGGHIILSVPFLYYLHGVPDDYFRFTRFGVERLAASAGLQIVEIEATGGLAHTILQAVSMVTTACLWTPRAPTIASVPSRGLAAVARLLDRLDTRAVFRQSVNAVLRAS